MTGLPDAALDLARRGWHVFPCRPGTKLPAIRGWPDVATTDLDQVTAWWERWPRANIGHVPGRSGVVVIDLDGAEGFRSWRELQRLHGGYPSTATVLSPREGGGAHLYFRIPTDFYVRSTAGKLAAGVDVRGSRGQAVLPPSVRADGTYRWADPSTPIAAAPAWLTALLRPPPPPPRRPHRLGASTGRLEGLLRTVATAQPGQRNTTLHWAACRAAELVANGASPDAVTAGLVGAAIAVGLDHREAAATVRSGLAKAPAGRL